MNKPNFRSETSPYIRKETSTKRMMIDVLIALVPVVVFSIYRFGLNVLFILLVSSIVMLVTELTVKILQTKGSFEQRFKKISVNNITAPLVSAVIFSMIVPDNLSLVTVGVGSFFGIFFGKMVFGGLGTNLFNPAGLGRAFIAVAMSATFAGAYGGIDIAVGATPLIPSFPYVLNHYSLLDLFVGNIPGAVGEINSLAILLGGAYLFIRRSADWRPVLSAAVVFTGLAATYAVFNHSNYIFEFIIYQLLAGGLLFGLIFMVTDPVTSPVTRKGRYIYGFIIGALVFIIRIYAALPEGVVFALLIGNALVPLLDYPKWARSELDWRFFAKAGVSLIVLIAVVIGLGGLFL